MDVINVENKFNKALRLLDLEREERALDILNGIIIKAQKDDLFLFVQVVFRRKIKCIGYTIAFMNNLLYNSSRNITLEDLVKLQECFGIALPEDFV